MAIATLALILSILGQKALSDGLISAASGTSLMLSARPRLLERGKQGQWKETTGGRDSVMMKNTVLIARLLWKDTFARQNRSV